MFDRPQTFIERDLAILRARYDVESLIYSSKANLRLLWREIRRSDAAICWFVLSYAPPAVAFSRLLGKPSLLIAGGWDVATVPEIGYGALGSRYRRLLTAFALNRANAVLAVSQNMQRWVRALTKRPTILAYHGFNGRLFQPGLKKDDTVLTVAVVAKHTVPLKGLKTFVEVARTMPQNKFRIAGEIRDDAGRRFAEAAPDNVSFLGHLPMPDLIREYQRARVYTQLSAQESFGCALAEAMLCGCTPVVTDRGALPEVAGDAARYVPYGDIERTAAVVRESLLNPRGEEARTRILERFSVEARRDVLFRTIEACLGNGHEPSSSRGD